MMNKWRLVGGLWILFCCVVVLFFYGFTAPNAFASRKPLPEDPQNSLESTEWSTGSTRQKETPTVVTTASTTEDTKTTVETTEWPTRSTRQPKTPTIVTTAVPTEDTKTTAETTRLPTGSTRQHETPIIVTTAIPTEGTKTNVETTEWRTGSTIQHKTPLVVTTTVPTEYTPITPETTEWPSVSTRKPQTDLFVTTAPTTGPQGAGTCDDKVCKLPRCACASDAPPAGLRVDEMPQFVMLTFDDAVNVFNMAFYRELLNVSRRKNKQNGCSIAATFFVSGEYLDYVAVNQLHSWGNEIALHSISHRTDSSYWQTINSTQWEREVLDQRDMLTAFANVPASDVIGFRGPFLFTGGDQGFSMLHKHLRYDSTLVHQRVRGERPFYPYTMDFGFRRSCNVSPCPARSYPGLWVLPLNVLFPKASEGYLSCAMADACLPLPHTATDTFSYLKSNFDQFYTTNRAPFPVFLHEAYLWNPERKAGYLRFVDWLLQKDDVYLVTAAEVLRFMEDPKPLSDYGRRACAGSSDSGASTCPKPTNCSYKNTPPGGERYMRTCSMCPKNYPWVNNPLGN